MSGIVDPAGQAWDLLAANEKQLRIGIAAAPDRKTKRAVKRELRRKRREAVGMAAKAHRQHPPVAH